MPELPDVEMFRKEAEKCRNSEFEQFEIKDHDFIDMKESDFRKKLKGQKFEQTMRQGKTLFLLADNNAAVVMHFGMTGELKYLIEGGEIPEYTKCTFGFRNSHALHYLSKRKLGHVELTNDINDYIKKNELGIDALEISENEFISRLKGKKSMIKSAITDQSIISGIGNIYSDEILFQSRIHPQKKANDLSESDLKNLFTNTRKVLKKAIEKEVDVSGFPADYLLPHRKEGRDCPKCNGKIKKIKVAGRAGYYCPSCQH
jgi:formamidopyrimidine-DNA glycosylase